MKSIFLYLTILILLPSCKGIGSSLKEEDILGKWMITEILGVSVISGSKAHFYFKKDGKLGGNTSCNNLFGNYKISDKKITFSKIGTTKMLCPGEVNSQEIMFSSTLPNVSKIKIRDGFLILENMKGEEVFKSTKAQ